MDVRIDIEQHFEEDNNYLAPWENTTVAVGINMLINFLRREVDINPLLSKIDTTDIYEDLDSSLRVFRIETVENDYLNILLSSENDPLFDQHILTLFRVVRDNEVVTVFKNLLETLSREFPHKEQVA